MESELNLVSGAIVNAAMCVHSALGPGLLEDPYKQCLAYELRSRGFDVLVEQTLPVVYKSVIVDIGYRVDLLVENAVIVELKSVTDVIPIHRAQLLSYLKLSKKCLGLLINFSAAHLKDGITRIVNEFPERNAVATRVSLS